MTITHLTYARVASKITPSPMVAREHSEQVDAFLLDHHRGLLAKAANQNSPVAFFHDSETLAYFEQLRTGTDEEFYGAADTLASRLVGQMDGRSAAGLFLCFRLVEASVTSAAVLKLEVTTPNSAVLDRLDTGEEVLSAVTNVLDAPGELQKGALVQDPRPGSDVVIGDKLAKDALYYPRAFGIRTEARPTDGTAELVSAIHKRLPSSTNQVLKVLPTLTETNSRKLLEKVAETVPELTEEIRAEVAIALEGRPRPVRRISPRAPLKKVVHAGAITISGPAASMRAVTWVRRPEGDWLISISVPEEPQSEFR